MKLTYRPEIDGLRAIAVVAVILYHAQITIFGHQPFKGGFIGVDIFFVISGYLITSIILKELVTTGSFSFKHFYERRVRRILPALLFVMLVSLPFAWMYLLPSSFVDFSKSILYSIGFSSNFYFHYSGQEYGAESGLLKPFLHTWSLSVEEQYYILFPLVLLITFKYFRKYLIHILILGFVISLGLADWSSRSYSSASFYFLHTRMWELLAGSIMAYFEITLGHRSKNKTLNIILPTIGLILIGHSILFFNDKMYHPSFFTLSPIIGVCLIIWFSDKNEFITKTLSTKLFVGIGLISYSLYLWHYPVFAFLISSSFSVEDNNIKFIFLIMILILSIATYIFIESPVRLKKITIINLLKIFIFTFFILFTFNLNVITKSGYKSRLPQIIQKNLTHNPGDLMKKFDVNNCYQINGCILNNSSSKKIYFIGDSHLAVLADNLNDNKNMKKYKFILFYGCLFFPEFELHSNFGKKDIKCNKKNISIMSNIIENVKDSIFIIGGRYPLHLNKKYFNNTEGGVEAGVWENKYVPFGKFNNIENSFKESLKKILKNNKVILIYPIPEVGINVPRELKKFLTQNENEELGVLKSKLINKKISTKLDIYHERSQSTFMLFDSVENENLFRVYPHKIFCDLLIEKRCKTFDTNDIFYSDDNHPSSKGAEMINDLIIKELEKIELKSN